MSKGWFGVHKVWGWYPTSWEGFVVIFGMIASISSTFYLADKSSQSIPDTIFDFLPFFFLTLAFTMLVATLKGQQPEFGKKNSKKKNFSPDNPKVYLLLPILLLPLIGYYLISSSIAFASVTVLTFLFLFQTYKNLNKSH